MVKNQKEHKVLWVSKRFIIFCQVSLPQMNQIEAQGLLITIPFSI